MSEPYPASDPFEVLMAHSGLVELYESLASEFSTETLEELTTRYRSLGEIGETEFIGGTLDIVQTNRSFSLEPFIETEFGQLCKVTTPTASQDSYVVVQGSFLPSLQAPRETLNQSQLDEILRESDLMTPQRIPQSVVSRDGVLLGIVTPRSICADSYLITRSARPAIEFLKAIAFVTDDNGAVPVTEGQFTQTVPGSSPDSVFWISRTAHVGSSKMLAATAKKNGQTINRF